MKQQATTAKKAQDSAERRVKALEGMLEDSDSKLAQAISVVSAHEKELVKLKELLK